MVYKILLENENRSINIMLQLITHFALTLLCQELVQKLHRLVHLFFFFFPFGRSTFGLTKKDEITGERT